MKLFTWLLLTENQAGNFFLPFPFFLTHTVRDVMGFCFFLPFFPVHFDPFGEWTVQGNSNNNNNRVMKEPKEAGKWVPILFSSSQTSLFFFSLFLLRRPFSVSSFLNSFPIFLFPSTELITSACYWAITRRGERDSARGRKKGKERGKRKPERVAGCDESWKWFNPQDLWSGTSLIGSEMNRNPFSWTFFPLFHPLVINYKWRKWRERNSERKILSEMGRGRGEKVKNCK